MNEILTKQPINQSVNHPINHSVNQSINQSTNHPITQSKLKRLLTLLSIIIIVPLGLATKYYHGSGAPWINNHLGGLFYVVFWCLLAFLFFPEASGWKIVSIVLLITVILEFLQLVHPKFLEAIRSTTIGRTIIGSSFNPVDFIFYFLGAGLGILWISGLKRIKK